MSVTESDLLTTGAGVPAGMRQAGATPGLTSCFGVEPPGGIKPPTPSLPWKHQEPLCGRVVCAGRARPSGPKLSVRFRRGYALTFEPCAGRLAGVVAAPVEPTIHHPLDAAADQLEHGCHRQGRPGHRRNRLLWPGQHPVLQPVQDLPGRSLITGRAARDCSISVLLPARWPRGVAPSPHPYRRSGSL